MSEQTNAPNVGDAPIQSGAPLSESEIPKDMSSRMDSVFQEVEETPAKETTTDTADKPVESDSTAETPSESTEEQPASATSETTAEPGKSGVILPEAHRRSLKAYGWTDDEINDSLKTSGNAFLPVAAKLHGNRNAEIAKWAELGRKSKTSQSPPQTVQAPIPAQQADAGPLKPIDIELLRKTYGDEAFVNQLVAVNRAIEQQNQMFASMQAQTQRATNEALAQQINGFFGDTGLKEFHTHYGTDMAKLSDDQIKARVSVIEMADALLHGAKVQGKTLSLEDALSFAHESVTANLAQTTVRKQITNSLQKRENSMTLRPAGRKTTPPANGEKELRANVSNRLKAVFGG